MSYSIGIPRPSWKGWLPATAQEGEAFTLVIYAVAAGRLRGKVVRLITNSLSSAEVLQAYHQSPKTHGMMSQIFSQVLGGQPLRLEACVQFLVPLPPPSPPPCLHPTY